VLLDHEHQGGEEHDLAALIAYPARHSALITVAWDMIAGDVSQGSLCLKASFLEAVEVERLLPSMKCWPSSVSK
jgi:hypothetical protein